MAILDTIKKVKRYIQTSSGHQLLSQWTSSQTVEMDNGNTLEIEMADKQKKTINITKVRYDALSEDEKNADVFYNITDLNITMFKSLRVVDILQADYNKLSDSEKHSTDIVYYIIESERFLYQDRVLAEKYEVDTTLNKNSTRPVANQTLATKIESIDKDIETINGKIENATLTTNGLTTDKCTITAGGYCNIGKLVIVNMRISNTSEQSDRRIYGLPTYNANTNIVSLNAMDYITGSSLNCIVENTGLLYINNTNPNGEIVSGVYICD